MFNRKIVSKIEDVIFHEEMALYSMKLYFQNCEAPATIYLPEYTFFNVTIMEGNQHKQN